MRYLLLFLTLALAQQASSQGQANLNILFVIADDWSYGHAGIYGDPVVRTPHIDALGRAGAVFNHAYSAAPSCSPARAAVLTGQYPHALGAGANLWGYLPRKFDTYVTLLEAQGYHAGSTRKGWGPGRYEVGGYDHNPAGQHYKDFGEFLKDRPAGKPFCFWFGSHDPHRPYDAGSGAAGGLSASRVVVPGWLPDVADVRADMLDYYHEVERFDRQLGELLEMLEATGEGENTLIVITSDNGMPFPRAKATLYDGGTRVPLIVYMPAAIKPAVIDAFVNLVDLAPTFLAYAGVTPPTSLDGQSLRPILEGKAPRGRDAVFTERERHANVRKPELGYPARAVRTDDYLYIRNYAPERWPAGDPELYHCVGPFGDVDDSPSKRYILHHRDDEDVRRYFELSFEKRPAEELYDLRKDPEQLNNVASDPAYGKTLGKLRSRLVRWQAQSADPRINGAEVDFDRYPYFGQPAEGAPATYKPVIGN